MLILGLDPGSLHTGYGLIACRSGSARTIAAGRWSAPAKMAVADRLRIGAVVDYLDLHWRGMHWPAFNLADIFIVGSAALLMLASFGVGAATRGDEREHAT